MDVQDKFEVGNKAEAVDSVGWWAPCTVKELNHADDGIGLRYVVGFDGWSSKWDQEVGQNEIRTPSRMNPIGRTRGSKTSPKRKSLNLMHLERGDQVSVLIEGSRIEAEIHTVDPLGDKVEVVSEGEVITIEPSQIQLEEVAPQPPSTSPAPKRKKTLQKPKEDRLAPDTPDLQDDSDGNIDEDRSRIIHCGTPNEMLLPSAPGADCFLSVGTLCSFQNLLLVLITSISLVGEVFVAKCAPCRVDTHVVGTYEDSELQCPTSQLFKSHLRADTKFSKVISKLVLHQAKQISQINHQGNVVFQCMLRKVRISGQIRRDIQNMLSGKSFKRTFEYVLDGFDYAIFCVTPNNRFVTFLLENGFQLWDTLLGTKWDVSHDSNDPTGKYNFVRSVGVKANLLSLSIVIVKAQSAGSFCQNYRARAIEGLQATIAESAIPAGLDPGPVNTTE